VQETVKKLMASGEKVGCLTVHLYRPFSIKHFIAALPASVKSIAVMDRTKEPGATGEPLFLDVVGAIAEAGRAMPKVIGGRYGLSSKEFTPGQAKAVLDELKKPNPKQHFVVGIVDDVTGDYLTYDDSFSVESPKTVRCVFYGLGSDGTVGANKNSIKIIGEETENDAQGYFVYDSKKSGSMTVSHLRFGPDKIRAPYLISDAQFVACHNFAFLSRYNVVKEAAKGAVFLLSSPYGKEELWNHVPVELQQEIVKKELKVYIIDANKVARETGMGGRINTVMQTCFFAISGVLPKDEAIAKIKESIKKTYGKRGEAVVQQNYKAVDASIENLVQVPLPTNLKSNLHFLPPVPANAPAFVKDVLGKMIGMEGDSLPVSALPADGTFPTGTTQYEKRGLSDTIPVWDAETCIQCGKCSFVCPHAVIRQKVAGPAAMVDAPADFACKNSTFKELPGQFTIQVSGEDCTGCGLCVEVCPAKNKTQVGRKALNMEAFEPIRKKNGEHWKFFLSLPDADRTKLAPTTVKASQIYRPLFEFSGACAGCGETPYVKLLSQLFGDRAIIANATGCSSIYGGNLPTTPYAKDANGRGPAWANSLFEDNAEFGVGMRLSVDAQQEHGAILLKDLASQLGDELVTGILNADQSNELGIAEQRKRVAALKSKLAGMTDSKAKLLLTIADAQVKRSVWILGGDGWAYDIGYGGLDHVLAMGRKVRVLVLDTEVYSNTGGQASKSTPRGAVAKFAAKGKVTPKKDLALMAMAYGYVYVAKIAMGASDAQTVKAFMEAEAHDGPSIIIAYSHCIAHGIDMKKGLSQQKAAVECGHWPLFRYNPALAIEGKSPLVIDSKDPTIAFDQYIGSETRYRMLKQADESRYDTLIAQAKQDTNARWALYQQMAKMNPQAPA
jgi:pyruvate-ferredoxin/flavodoxin oxidoreductase